MEKRNNEVVVTDGGFVDMLKEIEERAIERAKEDLKAEGIEVPEE